MKLKVEKKLIEYLNKQENFKNSKLEDITPFIEKAMEKDLKELLNIFGINGHPKTSPVSIGYKSIISKEKYRAMWLIEGYSNFHNSFYKIMKELFDKNIKRLRFNISLTITKAERENFISDYYYFEFHFKYFGNNSK